MAVFPWNLVLYVPEVQPGVVTLDEYDNPVEPTLMAQYLIAVSEDNQQPILKSNPGLDTAVTTLSGRCTGKIKNTAIAGEAKFARSNIDERVKYLPSAIAPGKPLKAELVDPQTKQKQTGVFVILSAFQSKYKVVTKVLGSRVNGYFEIGR